MPLQLLSVISCEFPRVQISRKILISGTKQNFLLVTLAAVDLNFYIARLKVSTLYSFNCHYSTEGFYTCLRTEQAVLQ